MATDGGAKNRHDSAAFVVDLASRMKTPPAVRPRPRNAGPASSIVYFFPAQRGRRYDDPPPAARAGECASPLPQAGDTAVRFTRPAFPFDTGRALLLGALGCYALILFNLIYGVASVSDTRIAQIPPAQRFNTNELQKQIGLPADARSPLGTPVWAGLCRPDLLFDEVRSAALLRAGNPLRAGRP
jgi:hypothetical protein